MGIRELMWGERRGRAVFERACAAAFAYDDSVGERGVFPAAAAVENLRVFDEPLPQRVGDAAAVVDLLAGAGGAATVAQTGGRYFGFVNGGAIPVALAARWLADFWDQNAALEAMSPLAAKLEGVVEGWLRALFGLPPQTAVGYVTGSTQAIVCALAAARWRLLQKQGWDVNARGLAGAPPLRIVASAQIHAAVVRAVALLGMGLDAVEWVETDEQGRVRAAALPPLDSHCILILQAGHVGSGAFDPFAEIFARADVRAAWVHIDGAFGLWAAACPRLSHLTAGMHHAQSWSVDNHKTLNVPYDSGMVLCADAEALANALNPQQSAASYLSPLQAAVGRDGMRYTGDMSRRARIVELWAAMKYLGRDGIDDLVFGLHHAAQQFAAQLRAHSQFEVLNEVVFNQVLLACKSGDDQTRRVLAAVQQSGECWMGSTQWQDRFAIRISICSWATTEEDITRTVAALVAASE